MIDSIPGGLFMLRFGWWSSKEPIKCSLSFFNLSIKFWQPSHCQLVNHPNIVRLGSKLDETKNHFLVRTRLLSRVSAGAEAFIIYPSVRAGTWIKSFFSCSDSAFFFGLPFLCWWRRQHIKTTIIANTIDPAIMLAIAPPGNPHFGSR